MLTITKLLKCNVLFHFCSCNVSRLFLNTTVTFYHKAKFKIKKVFKSSTKMEFQSVIFVLQYPLSCSNELYLILLKKVI